MDTREYDLTLLARIQRGINQRLDLAATIPTVQEAQATLRTLPATPNNVEMLDWLARWIDIDESILPLVADLVAAFATNPAASLREFESAHLEIARALLAFHHERYTVAIKHLQYALSLADHLENPDLRAVTRYALARCHWKRGEYQTALCFAREARDLNQDEAMLVALIGIVEAWLLFQMDDTPAATAIFDQIEPIFEATDDHVNKANVMSARGRIARQAGDYDSALRLLGDAILEYKRAAPTHRNVARALSQIAFVKRLQALESTNASVLRGEAYAALEHADEIYDVAPERHVRGRGTVHNVLALLKSDEGMLDGENGAWAEAGRAYELGHSKNDFVVTGNSRIIQCVIALKRGKRHHVMQARWYAGEAVKHAARTSNRRLHLRAQIWHARTALRLGDPIAAQVEWIAAEKLSSQASRPASTDYLSKELESLSAEIREAPNDGVVAIVSRLDVVSRRLKDVLDAVEVGVVNLVYRECKQVVATTKRRLHCDIRRVNDAVSRALDDRRDVEAVAREIAKGAVLHPLSHSSFTREQGLHIDISAEAEIELKKVGASDKLTEAIKRIGADPLCREADRLTLDHHELYRLAVVLNQVDQTALVYEVIRIPTESPFAAVDDPLSIARIVLWRVRTV